MNEFKLGTIRKSDGKILLDIERLVNDQRDGRYYTPTFSIELEAFVQILVDAKAHSKEIATALDSITL